MNKAVFVSILAFTMLCNLLSQGQRNPMTEDLSNVPSLLPGDLTEDQAWQLVFNDEFGEQKLNPDKWKYYGAKEALARRDGYWTSEAVHIDTARDVLVMKTYEKDGQYYDGCIHTNGILEATYGYFEIRAQLHRQEGHWPAFWLWSGAVDRVGKGGVDGAEIDIFEKFKTNKKVSHNIHWDGYFEHHRSAGKKSRHRRIMKGFHTFGLWWSSDFYRFYVDGKMVWETTEGGVCEVPLHLLISDEVGKHKRMRSIEKAKLPDEWLVDFVRVYQLE